jgi:hypothetical protein
MNTDQLRSDLRVLSGRAPDPSSRLADDVLRRRRAVRSRRFAVAGAGLGVALVVGLVPVVGATSAPDRSTAAPAVDAGTRGSLAADGAFVDALRSVPWTYQQWRSPGGSAVTMDPQLQPAPDWTSETTDLAAAYRPDQRDVLFAGDVPGGRWALVALHSAGGDTIAWFTGPADARPDQMTISGMPQSVSAGEPLAHVDLADAQRTLVVVTDPGDAVEVSDRAVLSADGTVDRTFVPLPDEDGDGVVVTTLDSSTRFGVAASVRVSRGGEVVWRSAPSTAGRARGIDQDDPRGWPIGIDARTGATLDPGYDYLDQATTTALGPFGLELEDLTGDDGAELTAVFQGSTDGSLTPGATPVITIYSIRMPSGARVLVGGWTNAPGDSTPEGLAPDQGVPYLDVRPADVPVSEDVVAARMTVGTETLVVSGPPTADTAIVLDGRGEELARVPLVEGMGSAAFPSGAAAVQLLDETGRLGEPHAISQGRISTWGDDGDSSTASFRMPFPPPA